MQVNPKAHSLNQNFKKIKKEYTEKYTDVSGGGILDESKKLIVPNFKVYFQTEVQGKSQTGHFMTSNDAKVSGKLRLSVDPKVLQELTDKAFEQYVADMKSLGYTVIDQFEFAKQYPDFKKYLESDNMEASPKNIEGQYLALSPTGWRMELPGFELGYNRGGMFASAFRQNLMKIMYKATDELEAISMQPVLIVSLGSIEGSNSFKTATVEAKQNISVMAQSKYNFSEDSSVGYVMLEKGLESNMDYGKIVRADTAGDTARSWVSAIGYGLLGKSENNSATWLLEANADAFKKAAWPVMKATQEMFKDKIKEEL